MTYEFVILDKEDNIAIVTFNRPDAMNALNMKLREEFGQVMKELEADDSIKVIILTGAGKAFVAGSDIKEFNQATPYDYHNIYRLGQMCEDMPKPVIAAVNGFCLGGGFEIALGCDIIIASEKAKFGQTELNVGVIPGGGGTQRLQRLVGVCKAKEMIFTCDIVRGDEAVKIGLANQVVPMDELMPVAKEMAAKIAKRSPAALKLAKQAVNMGMHTSLSAGLAYEREMFSLSLTLEDKTEGVNAFIEKREPVFKGK